MVLFRSKYRFDLLPLRRRCGILQRENIVLFSALLRHYTRSWHLMFYYNNTNICKSFLELKLLKVLILPENYYMHLLTLHIIMNDFLPKTYSSCVYIPTACKFEIFCPTKQKFVRYSRGNINPKSPLIVRQPVTASPLSNT